MTRLLVLFILLFIASSSSRAQDKHSIIIALGGYWKYGHYWNDINSANDAELLKTALLSQGFKSDNMHIVSESETKEEILQSIETLISNTTQAGDFVHIHFSGHGQQVADTNGDEVDGYDEALVPLSAPSRPKYLDSSETEITYNGNLHLTDDEFGMALQKVRKHLGSEGELLVSIDACHSGTSTRGIGIARGSSIRIEPEGFEPTKTYITDNGWFKNGSSADELARMVTFYASSSQELNYEYRADNGKNYGPLSYALSSAISQGYLNFSFEELFYRVKQKMVEIAPSQSPFADGLDMNSFNGESSKPTLWITDWISEKEFELSSGFLMGVREGSIVEGINANGNRWTATITESKPTKSIGLLLNPNGIDASSTNFVKLILPRFDQSISICFDIYRRDDEETLEASLNQFKSDKSKCSFEVSLRDNKVAVTNKRGLELSSFTPTRDTEGQLEGQTIDRIRNLLIQASTIESLVEVSLDEPSIDATLNYYELLPKEGLKSPSKPEDFAARNRIQSLNEVNRFVEGTFLEFRITNKSTIPIYYALIDIMPNGEYSMLIPRTGMSSDEYYLEPGQSNERRNQFFQIGPPYGLETMKLILSEKPIDWNSLNATRGDANEKSEFEKAIQSMMSGNSETRGKNSKAEPRVDISTYQYRIVPQSN